MFVYNHPAGESNSNIVHNIDIDAVVNVYGMNNIAGSWRLMTTLYPEDPTTYSQSIYSMDSNVISIFSSFWFANRASTFYVILEYTKKTN